MSQLKGKTVFMVLYNYSDCDYSIVIIMENLTEAYEYICIQEHNYHDKPESFKMITVNRPEDICKNFVDEHLNICYIASGKYNKFCLSSYCSVSHYAIVPMVIN
jgi:hypothetical protein